LTSIDAEVWNSGPWDLWNCEGWHRKRHRDSGDRNSNTENSHDAPLSNAPNLLLSLPLATSLLCSATHAGAQTTASFTVLFAFSANNQDVPAGSYNVQLQDRFLYLRSLKSTKTVSQLLTKRRSPRRAGRRLHLVREALAQSCRREWRSFDREYCEQLKGNLATSPCGGFSDG
jgi:hypothetical protein